MAAQRGGAAAGRDGVLAVGLGFGLAVPPEAALSAAGVSVVLLGSLGNVFFPLSGTLLALAKWTPLYGYASLARYPIPTSGAEASPRPTGG